jgi:hypothetical protein
MFKYTSQNGYNGFALAGSPETLSALDKGTLVRGSVRSLGKAAGLACYEIVADEASDTVVSLRRRVSVSSVAGVTVIEAGNPAAGQEIPALVLASVEGAVIEVAGYNGRGHRYEALASGASRWEEASPAVLLAAGLVEPAKGSVREIPAPAAPTGALAAALARAGLA